MKKIILAFVILLATHTLRLPNHYTLVATLPQPVFNYPRLIDTTKNLESVDLISNIMKQTSFMLKTLQMRDVKKYSFLIGLQRLKEVLKNCKLVITQNQKICLKQINFNKTQIDLKINDIQEREKVILALFNQNLELQPLLQNIKNFKIISQSYLTLVIKTIGGSFCHLTQPKKLVAHSLLSKNKKVIFKNNLEVSNWFYGSTNQLKYKTKLFKKALNFNLTTCPKQKPFVRDNQQICFNCPPNSIYNLGNQKCDSCPSGKMFNVAKNICEPCFGQMFIINHQFVCKACVLESEQLFNPKTGKCYTCKVTEYLDTTAHACKPIKCPADQPKYNKQLQICQECKPGQAINPKDPTQCLSICPTQRPVFDKIKNVCTVGPQNEIYMSQTKSWKKIEKKSDSSLSNKVQNVKKEQKQIKNTVLSHIANIASITSKQSSLPSSQQPKNPVFKALIPPLTSQPKK